MNRKQLRAEPRAGHVRAGTACLFLFPFDIFHSAAGPPVETHYRRHRLRVYPPFANDADSQLPHLQVRLESVPRLPGTTPPHVLAPGLHDFRATTNLGSAMRGDGLRVDLLSSVGPGEGATYVDGFLELARMFSLQWWITRDRRFDEAYLRNTFEINEKGERLGGVALQTVVSGQFRIERPLTRPVFEAIAIAAAKRNGRRSR